MEIKIIPAAIVVRLSAKELKNFDSEMATKIWLPLMDNQFHPHEVLRDLLCRSIDDLEFGHAKPYQNYNKRIKSCLRNMEIRTVRELVQQNERSVLEIRNFGKSCLGEVKATLAKMGLALGMKLDELDAT